MPCSVCRRTDGVQCLDEQSDDHVSWIQPAGDIDEFSGARDFEYKPFGFSYGQFASTNGYDLCFSPSDGSTNLNYEIEKWNSGGSSYVWVQVPQLYSGCYIWAYWGNTNASVAGVPSFYSTNYAVWPTNAFVGVWHMAQSNTLDSTANGNNGTASTATWFSISTATGIIGGAQQVSGGGIVNFTNSTSLSFSTTAATYSGWVYFNSISSGEQTIVRKEQYRALEFSDATHVRGILKTAGGQGWTGNDDATISPAPAVGQWYYVASTYDGSMIRNFFNGVQTNSWTVTGTINADTHRTSIGSYNGDNDSGICNWINGIIDEVRAEQVFRSSNWIWATYLTVASNTSFNTYGSVQGGGANIPPTSWLTNYYPGVSSSNYPSLAASVASNGMTVWQNYLAGLSPTNTIALRALISISNGNILVTYPTG